MRRHDESGIALVSVLLVMMFMAALLVGFFALISSDQAASGVTRDQTQAYAAAHAGLEKLTADLGAIFTAGNFSPTSGDLDALTGAPPVVPGFGFEAPGGTPGYVITAGAVQTAPIPSGPYQGLVGLITPYDIRVVARGTGGAEVEMRRTMQTIAVPVFQFGLFSENDLSFFAGPNFNFGGRVHSNANVFLAQNNGATLTLEDRVTAVGEILRTHLANGLITSTSGHQGNVRMALAPGVYRDLGTPGTTCSAAACEGSVVGSIGSSLNEPLWTNLSVGTYNGYIRNGRTGARRLDLPLTSHGATAVDLIRRPSTTVADTTEVLRQRFYSMASLRILLSDRAEDLTGLPTVTATAPYSLDDLTALVAGGYTREPVARSTGVAANGYRTAADTSLIGGFIKIERQNRDGVWSDVTQEILNLGFTGRNLSNGTFNTPDTSTCTGSEPNPNAVVRLQRVRDTPSQNAPCGVGGTSAFDYWPNTLYDTREGRRRDSEATSQNNVYWGGVMHYVELDVNNLRRWLIGEIGTTGNSNTMDVTGYVVYFSDRRGNRDFGPDGIPGNADDRETGELGFEDFVNTASTSASNNVLDPGEDMNGNGVLDVYGATPRLHPNALLGYTYDLHATQVSAIVARSNRAVFFRRALKLVRGARGQLPSNGLQGLTVASENPVYIHGNYNACLPSDTGATCTGGFGATGDGHVSAAVIADAVTLLSNNWNDIRSFATPHNPGSRAAATTHYRTGVIAGKGINFTRANVSPTASDHTDLGTDGGAHNFLRYLEGWSGQQLNYRGSIVSFYTSRQAVGVYKCCNTVYNAPTRGYRFDAEFLTPSLLPPRTPMFRDVNTLTFRQILRPQS
jgi:hypothetical protein